MFWIALIFWLVVLVGIVFHYRKTEVVSGFFLGFASIWYFVGTAKQAQWEIPTKDARYGYNDTGPAECGIIAGVISVIVAALALLVVAGWTLFKTF